MRHYLAITGGLALAISLLAVLPAAAEDAAAPISATTTMPNAKRPSVQINRD